MSNSIAQLYEQFTAMSFPRLGYSIGDFPLHDAIIAGAISSYLHGAPVHPAGIEPPDAETCDEILALHSKSQLTEDEQYFLEYFHVLEELRLALKRALEDA